MICCATNRSEIAGCSNARFAVAVKSPFDRSSCRATKSLFVNEALDTVLIFIVAGFKSQSGVTESFFDENMELSNLRKQVDELQISRDSLQEQVKTKSDKIEKLVGPHMLSLRRLSF